MTYFAVIFALGLVGCVLVYRVERDRRSGLTQAERDEEDQDNISW